jgi:type I restriction enzyme S subunit
MTEWVTRKLGHLIDIKHGWAFKCEYFSQEPSEYVLLTPGNFHIGGGFKADKFTYYTGDIPDEYILHAGDIIVTMTDLSKDGDTLGYPAKIPKDDSKYLHNQRLGLIRPKSSSADLDFIYWLMRSRHYQRTIVGSASGSTVRHTSPSKIQEYEFQLPPLNEQINIARILTVLENRINLIGRQNETLENIAQVLFNRWFVDFEFPSDKERSYKSSGGRMILSEEFGEIPEEWSICPLDNIANFLNGLPLQNYPPNNPFVFIPVIKIRELMNGITDITDKASPDIDSRFIINYGDIIFSWSGTLEVVIWNHGKGALNQHLFKVDSNLYPKWLYYYWIKRHIKFFRLIAQSKATTMGHIQRHHISESMCLIPKEDQLKCMDSVIAPIIDKVINSYREIDSLTKIRKILLPKLISGQIRVTK